ncbi:hypothetical protein B0J11DRAFT_578896 [Dendryphion nanum]|uniref:Uncharacterized protein n=1 Tax=Dendryphion nanum TaxID=256645 RepID=A0A9P9IN67_9PLEO|nr:hypothetical protein B0J11DRAFT_578896 [Dendryphion nanum]
MYLPKVFIGVIPFASTSLAAVFVAGFNDPRTCNQGVGGTLVSTNGNCVGFNTPYTAIQAAGGGSDSCFMEIFHEPGCVDFVGTRIGPINQPQLGGCIGPFNINGSPKRTIKSARLVNCPP